MEESVLQDHERGLTDGKLLLEHQLVDFKVYKERCKARESEDKKSVIDCEVELANVKEAMRVLDERVLTDRSLIHSAVEDHNSIQEQLATTSAELQIAEEVLTAGLDQLEQCYNYMQLDEIGLQARTKYNLQNCIQMIFDQVKQSPEVYPLNV